MRKVISNTSCLIALNRIGKLHILNDLYGKIVIPTRVKEEFGEKLEKWVKVVRVKDKQRLKILEAYLDRGEAEVIGLGLEIKESLLILDDLKARNMAKELGLKITGTLGIILKAKAQGIINSVDEILKALEDAGFRISISLKKETLNIAKKGKI